MPLLYVRRHEADVLESMTPEVPSNELSLDDKVVVAVCSPLDRITSWAWHALGSSTHELTGNDALQDIQHRWKGAA